MYIHTYAVPMLRFSVQGPGFSTTHGGADQGIFCTDGEERVCGMG